MAEPEPRPETAESGPRAMTRPACIALFLVLALSAGIRAWLFVDARDANPTFVSQVADARYYDEWALRLAHGESNEAAPFYEAPLYPHFLGAVYAVVDRCGAIERRFDVVVLLQLLLGLASVALLASVARRAFDDRSGWIGVLAALLFVLYPTQVYFESKLLANALETFLLLLALRLLLGARADRRKLVLAGLVGGVLCTARADKLLFVCLAAVWVAWSARSTHASTLRGALAAVAAFLLPAALCVGTVTARNAIAGGDPVLIAANGGVNFWFGNQEHATGVNTPPGQEFGALATQRDAARKIAQADVRRKLRDSEVSAYFFRKGLDYVTGKTAEWSRLLVKKMQLAVSNDECDVAWSWRAEAPFDRVLQFLPVGFALLFGLGVAGMVLSLRGRPAAWLLLGPILCSSAVLLAFFMSARFRLAAVPMLAAFGGAAVVLFCVRLRERRVVLASVALATAVGMGAVSWANVRSVTVAEGGLAKRPLADGLYANAATLLGNAFVDIDRLPPAVAVFHDVLRADPQAFKAHQSLGIIAHKRARRLAGATDPESIAQRAEFLSEARSEFETALRMVPQFGDAHAALGFLLMEDDVAEYALAAREFAAAVRYDSRSIALRVQLVKALLADGRVAEARQALDKAKQIAPNDPSLAELESSFDD